MTSETPVWLAGAPGGGPVPERGAPAWEGLRVVVTGLAVSGAAAAYALAERGARVLALDGRDGPGERERAQLLDVLGGRAVLGEGAAPLLAGLPDVDGAAPDLVVTSPGWRPTAPLLLAAAHAGVPVWGEVELAWRLRGDASAPAGQGPGGAGVPGSRAPWLCVTGTNGKTTTTTMLAGVLRAEGLRATAAGNIGTPLVEAVLDPAGADVLAVELSSFQLHGAHSLAPRASAVLNLAPDHLDWHGSMAAYAADKGRIYSDAEVACVYNADDPADADRAVLSTERLVVDAEVQEGCRAIGFTLGVPGRSMLGVVDDVLADRAFVADRATSAAELCTLADLRDAAGLLEGQPLPPHVVANALAAAALARAHGVRQQAVRDGLLATRPGEHRIAVVARSGSGVTFVDDSKATNAHAASASLAGTAGRDDATVVWVAGGLAKGAVFDELVTAHAGRLRAVVLIGADREPLRSALARQAPRVPVVEVDDERAGAAGGVMPAAVAAAAGLARPGDTVLLAPASASMDQFRSYAERGDAFAAAVRAHLGAPPDPEEG